MTLCAVWLADNMIHLASDSRLSFSDGRAPIDGIMKIHPLPVTIWDSRVPPGPARPVLYSSTIGLAVIGNLHTMYGIIGVLRVVLDDLVATPGRSRIGIEELCGVIQAYLQNLGRTVAESLFADGLGELLVCGVCPERRVQTAFHFWFVADTFPIRCQFKELTLAEYACYFGSGAEDARRQMATHPHRETFKIIRAVIEDAGCPSVGGVIQYGSLRNDGFILFGTYHHEVDDKAKRILAAPSLAGLPLLRTAIGASPGGLRYSLTSISPFADEIAALRACGYDEPIVM
jgi:hypothetical protein